MMKSMKPWMVVVLFICQSAVAAIHPLSLLSADAEKTLSPLSEIKFDQLIRPDQRLTNTEMEKMDSKTWEQYLLVTQNYFPTKEQPDLGPVFRSQGLPPTLLESGRRLREIRRIIAKRSEFTLEAFEFFSQCTENKQILETIQTLCLGHAWSLARDFSLPFETQKYPEEWLELASLTFTP